MFVVPITIEPFTIDDPNANYAVQLTGELESIVTDENKAFLMIERFNSAMSARMQLDTSDIFCFQLTFSSDVCTDTVKAAYLLNMTVTFMTQHSEDPDDGQDRALIEPPVEVGDDFSILGNILIMSPSSIDQWECGRHCFQSAPLKVKQGGEPGETFVYHVQITGTLGIKTQEDGPLYYLPFSHDPIIAITAK